MTKTAITKRDAVNAAMGIAENVAAGTLPVAELEVQLLTELRVLFGTVVGPGDPLWELQIDVARGVLAQGGILHQELLEWAAVGRRRAGEAVDPPDTPAAPVSSASVEQGAGNDHPDPTPMER